MQNATLTATNGGVCTNSYLTGDYSCGVASGWSGTVTPSHSGYVFSPTSRNYSNVTTNQTGQNYSASAVYHLAGTVMIAGAPAAGITLSGSGATCTSSDSSGNYDCTVPSGWSGTITPSYSGYTFDPASRNYSNVTANQGSQGYTVVTYQVSGTVALNGVPLVSVAFAASNGGSCTTSNISGQYSCTLLAGWSGTVTPSATGYSFTPPSRNYTSIAADDPAEDYAASLSSPTSNISFIHADHLNTPRVVADSAGTTVWRWDQVEPFGVNVADEDPDANSVAFELPLRFPGQYADKETNLHYNYFRDYDPSFGRYAESDPVGLEGGINTYLYVSANPLANIDPSGLLTTLSCSKSQARRLEAAAKKAAQASNTCLDCPDRSKFKNALQSLVVKCLDSDWVEGPNGRKMRVCGAGSSAGGIAVSPSGFRPVCGCLEAVVLHETVHLIGYDEPKALAAEKRCFKCAK